MGGILTRNYIFDKLQNLLKKFKNEKSKDIAIHLDLTESNDREIIYTQMKDALQNQPVKVPVRNVAPVIQSSLRHGILKIPEAVYEASGIIVNGRRLCKPFLLS